MGNRSIRIEGCRILAQALLSQGPCTTPGCTFVAYNEEKDEYFHATYDYGRRGYGGSIYWQGAEGLAGALQGFAEQVERDANRFLAFGTPLTTGDLSRTEEEDGQVH